MDFSLNLKRATALAGVAACAALPGVASSQSAQGWDSGKWRFAASLYAYLPDIGGSLAVPFNSSGGASIDVDADTIVGNLNFTVMGSFDAHYGRWGFFTDLIYLDVSGDASQTRDFSIGQSPTSVTADLGLDLKGTLWTLAGEYLLVKDGPLTLDGLVGARMFDVKPKITYSFNGDISSLPVPGRSGSQEVSMTKWDGVVGLKGRYTFGDAGKWNVPFYVDVGTGESDLTWQAAAGIAYSFGWGDVVAMWRHLDYNFKSGAPIKDMNFNGPMVGALFKW